MKDIITAGRAVGVAGLTLIAVSLSGCGWFGGHDEPATSTTTDGGAMPGPAETGPDKTAQTTKEDCPPGVGVGECGGTYLLGKNNGINDTKETEDTARGPGAQIGVNSYLWRASLDTVSFMPLISVDPFGGVIITDWYSNPNAPNERFKMTVYVLDTQLRADAVKVNLFKQVRGGAGWSDSPSDAITASKLEDAILTRARELRLASLPQQ